MRKQKTILPCACCGRVVSLTFHHLIPRKMHRRKGFRKRFSKEALNVGVHICRKCHKGVHATYDEITLATRFDTLDKLLGDEALAAHFHWVSKQRESL
jgi:Na+-translocating ferredoxin:NAD+ oxidoreductase RnfC subunit